MGKIRRGGVVDAAYALVSTFFWFFLLFGVANVATVIVNAPDGIDIGTARVTTHGTELGVLIGLVAARWAVGAALLFLLRAIVLSVKKGDPFSEGNVKRLRVLAGLFLAGPLMAIVEASITSNYVGGFNVSFGRWVSDVLVGLVVLVLAEVFAQGIRLRTDVEGTV